MSQIIEENSTIFATLIEESPMPIALYVGAEMLIRVANKAILNAWGRDESVIGKNLADALPELKEQPFLQLLNEVYQTGVPYIAKEDKVHLTNKGVLQTYYFDFIYKPLKDSNGKVWAILNNATDVTELVNARLKVKESEALFRKMIKEAPVAIGVLRGPNFIIEQANAAILKIWGKTEDVIGLELLEGLPEIKDQPFPDLLKGVYETGVAHYGYETLARLERKGILEDCYFNYVYDPIRDNNHQVSGIMVVANEVTNQVRYRNEVTQSEERFRRLVLDNPMPTALYETEDIVIKLANQEMLKLWGKDESVIGKPIAEAIPELLGQPFIPLLQGVIKTGTAYHADQEEAVLMVDGEWKKSWFSFTYKPLRNVHGETYGVLHAAIDVTKQVQLQQQKDEFLGIASHELKTPVTSIKAYAQVLEKMIRNEGDQRKAEMVKRMDIQINRLTGLIGDLLDVTKIQSGKMTFNPSEFEFDALVLEMVEEIQHTTSKHQILMDLNTNTKVFADRERIGQVIVNFLTNAIKYSTDSEHIEVKSALADNEVILSVKDYGIGISKHLQHLVFDQFYRVSGKLQHTYPGLGLGLYISSEIIKNEGGRIWVESEEGEGATFFFALKL